MSPITLHKVLAYTVLVAAVVHVVSWISVYSSLVRSKNPSWIDVYIDEFIHANMEHFGDLTHTEQFCSPTTQNGQTILHILTSRLWKQAGQ